MLWINLTMNFNLCDCQIITDHKPDNARTLSDTSTNLPTTTLHHFASKGSILGTALQIHQYIYLIPSPILRLSVVVPGSVKYYQTVSLGKREAAVQICSLVVL